MRRKREPSGTIGGADIAQNYEDEQFEHSSAAIGALSSSTLFLHLVHNLWSNHGDVSAFRHGEHAAEWREVVCRVGGRAPRQRLRRAAAGWRLRSFSMVRRCLALRVIEGWIEGARR